MFKRPGKKLKGKDARATTMKTEILTTHTRVLFDAAVQRAVELLRIGEVVALPT
jgi:hypothetical protein